MSLIGVILLAAAVVGLALAPAALMWLILR